MVILSRKEPITRAPVALPANLVYQMRWFSQINVPSGCNSPVQSYNSWLNSVHLTKTIPASHHVCSALIPQRQKLFRLTGSFSMSKFSVSLKYFTCLLLFALKAFGSVPSRNTSSAFLAYNDYNSHAVYDVRAWRGPGTLSFLFSTQKSDTFLAYQDDNEYSNFDVYLDNGNIHARTNFDECPLKEFVIQGNFSDSRWHRVRLTRELRNLTLTVDGCHSQTIPCEMSYPEREPWHALYVGSIPWNINKNSLARPAIYDQAIASAFKGCIGHITQSAPEGSPRALPLRYSVGTGHTCGSRCAFGGKCRRLHNDVTGKECECPEYEVNELMCRKSRSAVGSHHPHPHTITTSVSSGYNPTRITSSILTSCLVSSNQSRVLRTAPAPSNTAGSSIRAQSTSVNSQNVNIAVSLPEGSVPGNSSSTQHLLLPVSSSFIAIVSPRLSSSAEVALSSSVDNKIAAMAKKSSSASCSSATFVMLLYVGMIAPIQVVIMNN